MANSESLDLDLKSPPFDRVSGVQRLASSRSGHRSIEHVRHQLFAGRDRRTRRNVLIKLTSKPGLVYQANLANEIASLTTINRELPGSRAFPEVLDHGRLADGRLYLVMSLFDEFPLATSIGDERVPGKMFGHLQIACEAARILGELHGVGIFHVDLNPMNILYRAERGRPVVRIVDFESSYEVARHGAGEFYNPPTTPGYGAPELARRPPDGRADVFSLGAVLYTLLAGFAWTWSGEVHTSVEGDGPLDPDLKAVLRAAVSPDPDARHASMAAFGQALAGYVERAWPGRSC
ncbi:MAG: serine/threonine protein kinase [Vicinamibacterales bacterium]